MPERTTVTQVVQIGAEVTPGTAVAANRQLPSLLLDTSIEGSFTQIDAQGFKFPTLFAPGKEWTAAKWSMNTPTYDELIYMLWSHLSFSAPVVQGATTAYKCSTPVLSTSEDTIKTLTIEQGSALRAHKMAYAIVTDLSIKGDRDKVTADGSILAQQLTDGITLTAAPTVIPQVPMLPNTFDVFIDATSGGLGATKLTRLLSWEFSSKNRFAPVWTVNSAVPSWTVPVEQEIGQSFKVLIEADATGMALLPIMRVGTTQFLRLKSTSTVLAGTAIPYAMQIDLAVQVMTTPKQFKDTGGVYAIEFTFGVIHDPTWGKAIDPFIMCKRTAF